MFMKKIERDEHSDSCARQKTLINETRFVSFDFELTGLDARRDAIVSIGAVALRGGRINAGECFYRLVRPRAVFTPASVVVHGITPSEVTSEQEIGTVLSGFLDFCGHDVLIGYCTEIDLAFLRREVTSVFGLEFSISVIDLLCIYEWTRARAAARRLWDGDAPAVPGADLADIARFFGVSGAGRHHALNDAFMTAQIFQQPLPRLSELGISGTDDLLNIGDPHKGGDYITRQTAARTFHW